jgi:ABC-2 type transport system permease protein
MTWTLIRKLLRDLRLTMLVVAFLLGAFQLLWAKITDRIVGELSPLFNFLAENSGMVQQDLENVLFQGAGKITRTLIGGEKISLDRAMDLLSISYVHPLMQTIFCIWAVGRAAGAIAGELDRGTMELLLAQPLARFRLLLAHFCVDLLTIPLLCLSLWGGNVVGIALIGPEIRLRPVEVNDKPLSPKKPAYLIEWGPFKVRLENPAGDPKRAQPAADAAAGSDRLKVSALPFLPALVVVGGLMFAISGYTMWLSARGRFRWRVLGLSVFLTLVQFLVNLVGQMWDTVEFMRPFTIFYYFQPQQVILGQGWTVPVGGVPVPMPAVLYGVGLVGYALALWTFSRRDLPAPL